MKKKLDIEKILAEEYKIAKAWEEASTGKYSIVKDGIRRLAAVFYKQQITIEHKDLLEGLKKFQKKWEE